MRRISILNLVILLVACSTPASEKHSIADSKIIEEIPANAIREKFADDPRIERITINDVNGALLIRGTLVNGKKEGVWIEFYPNGVVKNSTPYLNGKKEGSYVELNTNGQFTKLILYHSDLKDGDYKEFIGITPKEERKYRSDKLEGIVKVYYPNGTIMEEGSYKNGTRDGISRWYNEKGEMSIEYEYKEGQLVKK